MLKKVKPYAAWIWMGVLFLLSSIPSNRIPDLHFSFADKLIHLVIYFILGILLGWRLNKEEIGVKGECWRRAFFIGVFYGVFDEVHQLFVPGRNFDIWDIAFDILGVFIGILVIKNYMHQKNI